MDKNTFAPTPPMGWNSYDYYNTTVTEADIKANADYMATNLKTYGWEYIVVDIQWYCKTVGSSLGYQYLPFSALEMDEYSRLLPDIVRFPSSAGGQGFAPLADYVHRLGLKFGIHIMRGIPRIAAHHHTQVKGVTQTADVIADPSSLCGWNPDMYGVRGGSAGQAYYDSLLELYASWGVDFIKCDDICNTNLYRHNQYSARHEVEMLALAIKRCGRPIVLSLSPGPALIDQAWHYEKNANMWRITDDFWDRWDLLKDMFRRCELWQSPVKAGCYPDCDMLPVGSLAKGFGEPRESRFTFDEQKTMMTLWCLFGSPLMIGAHLPSLDEKTLTLLTNQAVLDMLPTSWIPSLQQFDDTQAIWTAARHGEAPHYIALFNLSDESKEISFSLENQIAQGYAEESCAASGIDYSFIELWSGLPTFAKNRVLKDSVPAHGVRVFRFVTET
ncbi:MAG: glycoside hydrolase family 27 protein [Clostridium sp.]|jgi:hypothetical protein|nr:glycoside hydrolase family 27 protein [Clostridium sp.]